ncbi:peptidoglycan D,D-transpeptidase FtsI family protein [Planotetraspora kaengkrachanensis]|uniref:Putative penicillin-binding protein PbpA n=1 Tax=Planotetraspora kaengkrachanensis TaxID=575193 RepID=A0A8J3V6U3_9ACTN|nr:penicillin-binding transpeptidase domain-containing protein [Planotetraspora kaengkrachanensis]GIG80968.1 putative penicillin-binding protein PbpA [Planotetraspora kaengkrachanensis]
MNGTLKRAAVACLLMFGLLMANVTYLGAVKGDSLRHDNRNVRSFYERYAVDRGWITADNGKVTLAKTVDSGDPTYRFERRYPQGKAFAHAVGYFAPESATGIEGAEGKYLDGSHPDLVVRRAIDLITNKPAKGASVDLTLNVDAQQIAYKDLANTGKRGAVVALDPRTGAILTMVSVPSYDPDPLAVANKDNVNKAYAKLEKDPNHPLLDRAIDLTYAPGSTFKTITSAAFLSDDSSRSAETEVDAPDSKTFKDSNTPLVNYHGESCGGRATLLEALTISCNTPFGIIGVGLGYDKLKDQAEKFGIGKKLAIPLSVAGSSIGKDEGETALAQTSIGQRSNQMTPMQMAMVAAGIANKGTVMTPYLVNKIMGPDGSEVTSTDPEEFSEAVDPEVASQLTKMMVNVVRSGTGTAAQLPGITVAGKTGTAETSPGQASHAWFISFAPADNPRVAVAVFVESGSAGNDASGGGVAAPIARDVMQAVLKK